MRPRATRRASQLAALAGLLLALSAVHAQAQSPEALDWLRKIHQATNKLSYTGTFVYQQGNRVETSRISRFADPSGNIEKLEVLDGVPREIVRTRDTVRCYLPESRVVKIDRRTGDRGFPSLLPEQVTALAQHYEISLGDVRRVAGFNCQAVLLAPKDNLRYGYELCADLNTGMLLKAVTVDPAGEPVEQFTFTQLAIGQVSRDKVRSKYVARTWRVEDASTTPANLGDAGWRMTAEVPGFRKITELRRSLGESKPVGQMVFSDGLAAVSVFIEPLHASAEPVRTGLASIGAIHIYTRAVADHLVTVVGEAPAESVQRIADAVEYRRP
jgi:sigma-E factor negative regulatory protein RseB